MLYAILYGNVPFKGNGINEMHDFIVNGRYELGEEISSSARNLIKRMLEVEVDQRISIEEILKHEWMENIDTPSEIFNDDEKAELSKVKDFPNDRKGFDTAHSDLNEIQFTTFNLDST